MASVAVWKSVNPHKPVMEAHRNFIRRIGLVFDAGPGVVGQLAQRGTNFIVRNSEIAFAGSELPGPAPYVPVKGPWWTMPLNAFIK
jgi:hypothetical protein